MSSSAEAVVVPEGFKLHRENSAYVLLDANNGAFLNTIQEFNRDLSVACIRIWSERNAREREKKWKERQQKVLAKGDRPQKRRRVATDADENSIVLEEKVIDVTDDTTEFRKPRITIVEPLSATGLRAIRYAKEIPLARRIVANDLSKDAVAAIRRNLSANGIQERAMDADAADETSPFVVVTHGDAIDLLYSLRAGPKSVDVVDLDPYGTAGPFIDGAVQSVKDGGLLCVTCTDLAILAGHNYPEKCFANYGGSTVRAEYCHEAALRLVLNSVATAAARYGRSVKPLLSLSIDFYVRLFIQVRTSPIEVKQLASKTAVYYACNSCQNWSEQKLGRSAEKTSDKGNTTVHYRQAMGPPTTDRCNQCQSGNYLAGPMWAGSLHEPDFVQEVLDLVKSEPNSFGTATRMEGMLTVAKEELPSVFYFTPSRLASAFRSNAPSIPEFSSALLHAGYKVSRSHALAGSIKTDAPSSVLYDIFRAWVKDHPVKMSNVKDESPTAKLLQGPIRPDVDFSKRTDCITTAQKIVRYQQNPTANWGPATRAGSNGKRKQIQQQANSIGNEVIEPLDDDISAV